MLAQLVEIREEYAALTPDQLKVIDPCSGSGHILAYMFDVLMKIYESYGYTTREAVASIVENNLYGLDIDDRAAQLAYFAVMMKARQYDRRFFSRGIQPHVYAIVESNHVDKFAVDYFCNGDAKLTATMDTIIKELHDAKEYGSILTVTPQDWSALYDRFAEITEDINMSRETALRELLPLVQVAEALAQKYDAVVTNPPYMGASGMSARLSDYVKKNYPDSKSDMSTVCMEKTIAMCKQNGYMAMINIPVWMFLTSYEKLRDSILRNNSVSSMVHPGRGIFGSDFGTTTFTVSKRKINGYKGCYRRLFSKQGEVESPEIREQRFFECRGVFFANQEDYLKIPGHPIAYWVSKSLLTAFTNGNRLGNIADSKQGIATADNNKYLRLWYEVSVENVKFDAKTHKEASLCSEKWYPYNKGGEFRKWYGNNDFVVNWYNDGIDLRNDKKAVLRNQPFYFKPCFSWSLVTSSVAAFRYKPIGHIFDVAGMSCFSQTDLLYLLALCNTKVVMKILEIIAPTINYQCGDIANIPVILSDKDCKQKIENKVESCINISRNDWDSFETSWDFQHHPLLRKVSTIAEAFNQWQTECEERFNQLKANEEELNRIFIDIYGLQDELTPKVEEKDVTVRKADLGRDIRSFISYAVGCMFGRYSLDVDGLAYAGGEWDASKYASFAADKDNIIPICDDEYFEDDIVGLFVEFVKTVYGANTLDENLKFIADALGGKGQPKDVIRNYFLSDFYSDHCKIYQKRPIYWLFDSGKKNGFKALIYMHRYQPDTIARIRTDYVHEQQARYRTAIADLEQRIANASTGERVKLNKKLTTLQAQDTEIRTYEEKIHHLADQMISIDLDDGVKKNYAIFQDVLAKIK